jgi:hypothetical protein
MRAGTTDWPAAIVLGSGATLAMDLWNRFLRRAFHGAGTTRA